MKRLSTPFPTEPIRTFDALYLSTILEWLIAFPELQVLSFDKRILQNLVPLGVDSVFQDTEIQ